MPSGLAALLDDIATIAKVASASIDDVAAAAGKASSKAAGVVIDDTAVTPQYVTGFTPDRELPIIWRIAKGSLFNKIVIILPVALLLSFFLPQAITPLLMAGGAFLCFEGAEKLFHVLFPHGDAEVEEAARFARLDPVLATLPDGDRRGWHALAEAIAAKRYSGLADKRLGTVPVNFLSNLDITGGNSGSPVLDAHGKLVGLAFDGNWESVSSNWVFDPVMTRMIAVDGRYLRWIMQEVYPAPQLLKEMNVGK